jgi:hypothetical protein
LAFQVRPGQPDTAEDTVVLVERVEDASAACAVAVLDRPGVVADRYHRGGDAAVLEVVKDGAQQRVAAEVEQDLVALVAEVLQAGAEARRRDESMHECLFSGGRP